jgi:hypothetical protein
MEPALRWMRFSCVMDPFLEKEILLEYRWGVGNFPVAVSLCVSAPTCLRFSFGDLHNVPADVGTIHAAPLVPLLCGICFPYGCTNSFLFRPPPLDLVALALLLLACGRKRNLRALLDDGCQTRLQGLQRENVLRWPGLTSGSFPPCRFF